MNAGIPWAALAFSLAYAAALSARRGYRHVGMVPGAVWQWDAGGAILLVVAGVMALAVR